MRMKYCHSYQVKALNRSISTTTYHNASIGNWDKSSINLVTGSREGSTNNMQVEQVVFCNAEKLLARLMKEIFFHRESIFRLEAVQYTTLSELYYINSDLENLAIKVTNLKNCPEERDKLLYSLKEKVLEQMENRITTMKKLEKAIRSGSDRRVKELKKLERKVKTNSTRNINKLRKLIEANEVAEGGKRVQVIGGTQFVDELKASSDILVAQISDLKNKVQDNLTKQVWAVCELLGDMELHYQRLISSKWDEDIDSE
ncbi:hypothetical protein HOY82DRAFT_534705 [Tuber indicum]|nr:hypothetical protein HOY82DRAFT_534705 [Tuber indicum]